MKILLLGGTGLFGRAIARVFKNNGTPVIAPSHAECDVTSELSLEHIIATEKPAVVINATGYTKVDLAEHVSADQERCFLLNAQVPETLAQLSKKHGALLVHLSTDYVFDGTKTTPYLEEDVPHPLSVYGRSKYAGENNIISAGGEHLIIRTAWPFGPGGKNFVDTMIELSATRDMLTVVDDQIGSPTYTLDFAQALWQLITTTPTRGIVHITNSGHTSWYGLARTIFEQLGVPQKIEPITTTALNRPAPRPPYSVLASTKISPLRSWQEGLTDYLMGVEMVLKA